jgi:hypothetical protein
VKRDVALHFLNDLVDMTLSTVTEPEPLEITQSLLAVSAPAPLWKNGPKCRKVNNTIGVRWGSASNRLQTIPTVPGSTPRPPSLMFIS